MSSKVHAKDVTREHRVARAVTAPGLGAHAIAMALIAFAGVACAGSQPSTETTLPPSTASSIVVAGPTDNVSVGGTVTLTATPRDASGNPISVAVAWRSSDTTVAPVTNSGVVTGVAPGSASIMAVSGNTTGSLSILVRAARAISALSLTPSGPLTVLEGTPLSLALDLQQPSGAPSATASWTSTVPSVASVDQNGRVTASSPGSAVITVLASTPAYRGYVADSRQASLTAIVPARQPSISALTVSPTSAALRTSESVGLNVSVSKAAPDVPVQITFQSSNAAIASVDTSGTITAVSPGTSVITVQAAGAAGPGRVATTLTAGVSITVTAVPAITSLTVQPASMQLATGAQSTLLVTPTQPSGAPSALVTYASSAPNVATVSNGVVTAVAPGSANITVQASASAGAGFVATTLTTIVAVTVATPTITLQNLAQGPIVTSVVDSLSPNGVVRGIRSSPNGQSGAPVDISNMRDIVRASVFLGSAAFDSVALLLADGSGANRVLLTVIRSGLVAGSMSFDANTAEFTVNAQTGVADVRVRNGLYFVRAAGWYRIAGGVREVLSSGFQVNVNNADGMALSLTPPSASFADGAGRAWYGGSGAGGVGTITVVPVIYTSNRSITSVTLSFARCPGTVVRSAVPFRATFGGAGSGADINCSGIVGSTDASDSNRPEDYAMVMSSVDNAGGSGPSVTYAYDPGPGAHPWAGPRPAFWRQSTTHASPSAIRIDYRGAIAPP